MSRHAHVNLLELEDSVNGVEGVEGRFGRGPMGASDIGVSHWRDAPNFRSPVGHKHREQEEAYLVVRGSGQVLLDGELSDSGSGTWSVSRPLSCGPSRPAPTGSSSSPSAARSPRAATAR